MSEESRLNSTNIQELHYQVQDQAVKIERLQTTVRRLEQDLRMAEFNRRHNR